MAPWMLLVRPAEAEAKDTCSSASKSPVRRRGRSVPPCARGAGWVAPLHNCHSQGKTTVSHDPRRSALETKALPPTPSQLRDVRLVAHDLAVSAHAGQTRASG
jgi:hypothetical protein